MILCDACCIIKHIQERIPGMKHILFVEDNELLYELWLDQMRMAGINNPTLHARTIKETLLIFAEYRQDIAVIVMDACLNTNFANTTGLVRWLRTDLQFTGPIIPKSSENDFSNELVKAGANRELLVSLDSGAQNMLESIKTALASLIV